MSPGTATRAQSASPWAVVTAFMLVAAFVTIWFPYTERRDSLAALQHASQDQADLIAYTIAPAIDFGDPQVVEEVFRGAQGDEDFVGISATGADGHEIARLGKPSATARTKGRFVADSVIHLPGGSTGKVHLVLSTARIDKKSMRALVVSGGIGATIVLFGLLVALSVKRSFVRITALLAENERARAAAEEANIVKSRFLANMSHEIRTPLNGVLGLSDVLSRRRLDGESAGLVVSIGRSARTLLSLVNDLLDLSRVEAGRMELEHAPMDVEAAAATVAEMLVPSCRKKGIEFVLDVGHDVPRSVMGDRLRFEQVLTNLVGNAVKFTAEGAVTVSLGWGDGSLRVSVEDNGIGIPAEKCATIFDAFSQADTSTTRRYGGSGLGLAISRQLVQQMGGDIEVTSEVGVGSKFSFALPCPDATPPEPAPDLEGASALVVARAPWTRSLLMAHAMRCGLSAEEASLRDVLAAKSSDGVPVVVLWDVSAPPPSGAERTQLARVIDAKHIRLIVHAAPFDEEPLRALAAAILPVGFSREAFEQATIAEHDESASRKATSDRAPKLHAHVLIAEDDETNQLVASSFLTELGVTAEMVGNGLLAVERATSGAQYDVILMDCQLPELDGCDATQRMRAWEQQTGRRRTPIVACTAHALPAERAHATAIGMDGYLTKPLTLESFRSTVAKYGHAAPATSAASKPAAAPATPAPAEPAPAEPATAEPARAEVVAAPTLGILAQIGHDTALEARLRDSFARGSSAALDGLAAALAASDWAAVARHAHTLKGSCLSLGAADAAALAKDLEARAKTEDPAGAAETLVGLEIAVEDVRAELEQAASAAAPR